MLKRYFYETSIADFIDTDVDKVLGEISSEFQKSYASLQALQTDAWAVEVAFLQKVLRPYANRGDIFFEYAIPRMGRRVDAIAIIDGVIFVLEFKVNQTEFLEADRNQVWDYALDLKNFHEESLDRVLVPILIATDAKPCQPIFKQSIDKVFTPINANKDSLVGIIDEVLQNVGQPNVYNNDDWKKSRYAPTPTIIEAARALFNHQDVADITRNDACAQNLSATCDYLANVIQEAQEKKFKAICFVTGVPGAGKTLVGLNIANMKKIKPTDDAEGAEYETLDIESKGDAVYLSGNFPLVQVLKEALAKDYVKQMQKCGQKIRIGKARATVEKFIQMIHHYRDENLLGTKIVGNEIEQDPNYIFDPTKGKKSYVPYEHIAIFDEAQRAWTKDALANFMKRKKKIASFPYSEPEYLISCLNRHEDWAVIICLVGGGQEINTGEAGIKEWIESLNRRFKDWHVYISDRLQDAEYASGKTLELLAEHDHVHTASALHLAASMRSFRAETLATFVHHLLDGEVQKAREGYQKLNQIIEENNGQTRVRYPIVLTRDLEKAKNWLKSRARGSERYGLVVSSQAERLKPLAIDVRFKPDVVHWFLDEGNDVRSSFYLEDVATEFDVQGLELDWTCVVWDGDFRKTQDGWSHHSFNGDKWQNINKAERRIYQKNAYRVLMTRARQGMVLVVPEGSPEDPTRNPKFYDSTFNYLKSLGIVILE